MMYLNPRSNPVKPVFELFVRQIEKRIRLDVGANLWVVPIFLPHRLKNSQASEKLYLQGFFAENNILKFDLYIKVLAKVTYFTLPRKGENDLIFRLLYCISLLVLNFYLDFFSYFMS